MNRAQQVIRAAAIILNLLVLFFWVGSSIHEVRAAQSRFEFGKGLLYASFVVPAIFSVVALVWIRRRAMRVLAVVSSILIATWWMFYSAAMPALSWFQLFWSIFAVAPAVAVVALVLDSKRQEATRS